MRILRVTDLDTLELGSDLFDDPPRAAAARRFLASPDHILLFAWDEADRPVGFISGVAVTHPDKGAEMYVNELGVTESARGRGVGAGLVAALARSAREAGCYAMWAVADPDNVAALATFRRAGAEDEAPAVVVPWRF